MYTKTDLGLGAFSLTNIFEKAQTAVQKIQATAKKVKESATQFLPPEAVPTVQTAPAMPISDAAAAATPLLPAGLPLIPLALLAGTALFFLRRKKRK